MFNLNKSLAIAEAIRLAMNSNPSLVVANYSQGRALETIYDGLTKLKEYKEPELKPWYMDDILAEKTKDIQVHSMRLHERDLMGDYLNK